VDLAYKLRANKWQDKTSVELELVGIRTPWTPILESKPAPKIEVMPRWQNLESLESIPHPALIYGYNRPEFDGDCDRPTPNKIYKSLILWTLPPSVSHLRWLIALTKPEIIYLGNHHNQTPNLPTIPELKQKLANHIGEPKLNLLALGQELWVAPCVIVSALRELGYFFRDYPPTKSLESELESLKRWYHIDLDKLSAIL
jgi:single-stranded-DNA-specific exonuclease